MFRPRVALASLSGRSDAAWATARADAVGCAILGGIAICPETRSAARRMTTRDRSEFLPADPVAFVDRELDRLDASIQGGFNVRVDDVDRLARVSAVCADHDAVVEINAHCRQSEMCAAGAGETLLRETDRLATLVRTAHESGATVSVKVRAEVDGVDLVETAEAIEAAGADVIHVDAMDSRDVIVEVAGSTALFVIANNGVREGEDVRAYLSLGADAVSVGRASDRRSVLHRVRTATEAATIDRKPSPR